METSEIFLSTLQEDFKKLTSSPLPFLQTQPPYFNAFKEQCKDVYDFTKSLRKSSGPDPLPKLLIDDFDPEQIWGQMELFNKKEVAICLKAADVLTASKADITLAEMSESDHEMETSNESDHDLDIANDEEFTAEMVSDEEDSDSPEGFQFEESDEEEDLDDNEQDPDEQKSRQVFEKTEVDDDFFSLREMEKFLETEDKKFESGQDHAKNDDIDYFEDIHSSNEDEMEDRNDEMQSSRQLKYSDYFNDNKFQNSHDCNQDNVATSIADKDESHFEKHTRSITKKIAALEEKSMEQAEWQMTGEVKGNTRPENSLLQETLEFDNVMRPQADITEEHTKSVEDLIKQRILDEAWDDVKRKYKKEEDPQEYKKRIVLDSSQSKLTLSEIYEKQYMDEKQKANKIEVEEKENEEHTAIKNDMDDLFRKLDALSNFHFVAPPPEPQLKLVTNEPTIQREEVQPVAHAESQVLAPEEIYANKTTEEKSSVEKTTTDKKRERRKKKLQIKARTKSKLERLKKLNPESNKVKQLEAVDQLKRASKLPGSNTKIIQSDKKSKEKMTSQKFFSKLQEKNVLSSKRKLPT